MHGSLLANGKLVGDSAEDCIEIALQLILGQDDVAVWSREIKLVIKRWNVYEPIRPAPLRLSSRHFIKEHSASNSSGERNKLKTISAKRRNRQSDLKH